jgi:DNA-directed RNA polymerase specialized sigma24 family protein
MERLMPRPAREETMSGRPKPDTVLIEQMVAGDARAWEEFRDRHSPSLYAQVFALVGDPAEADQVLEETFHSVWCSADQFDLSGDIHASAWLAGLARGVVLTRRRLGALAPGGG